jgi:peptidoglycan/LPS O-acetylase OafA/YrhL
VGPGRRPSIAAMPGDHHGSLAAPRASSYLPGLDGLRAVSVIAVLLYHADMPWLNGGFLGVEVFFVISGYLITLLLTQEHTRSSTISLTRFWLRRARRLLAALYTLLATVSVIVLVFYREDASTLAAQVWAALTYVTNWFLIVSQQSYFALVERPPVFQHLWSLAIEEQFYLVWPILLLGLLRLFKGRHLPIAGVVTAGAIASLLWMAYLFEPAMDPSRAYYGTDTRASGLLFGCALALVWKPGRSLGRDAEVKGVALDLAGLAALGVIIGCFAQIHDTDELLYRGGLAVLSLASCVAIAAIVHPGTIIGRLLGLPMMTWVGKRSYSLYLWHWPIFVFTRPQIDWPLSLYPTLVLRLVLTVVAAELSYRLVEVPIRNGAFARWRQRLRRREGARRRAGPIALAGAAGVLLVAVNTVGASGTSSLDRLTEQGSGTPATTLSPAFTTTTAGGSDPAVATPTTGRMTGVVAGAAGARTVAPTTAAATTVPDPRAKTITVLGDSVLLGAKDQLTSELQASGYSVDYEAIPALMIHNATKDLVAANAPVGETVICGLGHNSLWERDRANYDKWAKKFDREADTLIQTLESLGAKRIIWVTLREPSESVIPPSGMKQFRAYVWYFPYVNERLRLLPQRHPEVVLADWAAVSNQKGLTYDAMHLTKSGTRLMIDTIRSAGGL